MVAASFRLVSSCCPEAEQPEYPATMTPASAAAGAPSDGRDRPLTRQPEQAQLRQLLTALRFYESQALGSQPWPPAPMSNLIHPHGLGHGQGRSLRIPPSGRTVNGGDGPRARLGSLKASFQPPTAGSLGQGLLDAAAGLALCDGRAAVIRLAAAGQGQLDFHDPAAVEVQA